MERKDGRKVDEIRPLRVQYDVFGYGAASVLLELGNTKVLCAVTLSNGVPSFMRGKGAGWLTAEYAMLPSATTTRTHRESSTVRRNGRSIEISRIIGRALRAVVDLTVCGERTITIDCDVLQADGGTRTACITGASLALRAAQERWLHNGILVRPILKELVGAVSVGVRGDQVFLDPDFTEDTTLEADFNVILTESQRVIEVQGGAEKEPLEWDVFDTVRALSCTGMQQVFSIVNAVPVDMKLQNTTDKKPHKAPLFSLKNRQKTAG